jgi:hypothetical protein
MNQMLAHFRVMMVQKYPDSQKPNNLHTLPLENLAPVVGFADQLPVQLLPELLLLLQPCSFYLHLGTSALLILVQWALAGPDKDRKWQQ